MMEEWKAWREERRKGGRKQKDGWMYGRTDGWRKEGTDLGENISKEENNGLWRKRTIILKC